jgi:hypothetical protein
MQAYKIELSVVKETIFLHAKYKNTFSYFSSEHLRIIARVEICLLTIITKYFKILNN